MNRQANTKLKSINYVITQNLTLYFEINFTIPSFWAFKLKRKKIKIITTNFRTINKDFSCYFDFVGMIYLKKSCKKLVESVTDIERMILKINCNIARYYCAITQLMNSLFKF